MPMPTAVTLRTPTDPAAVACFFGPLATPPKRLLFACAAAAPFAELIADPRPRRALGLALAAADGSVPPAEVAAAVRRVEELAAEAVARAAGSVWTLAEAQRAARATAELRAARAVAAALGWALGRPGCPRPASGPLAAALDGFAEPPPFDPAWRTTAVRGLADAVRHDGAFDRLPILADALEEAGCDDAELLAHLRGDGPHVRGCWAVDVVLGRAG